MEPNAINDAKKALKLAKESYGKNVDLEKIEVDRWGRDCWGIDIEAAKKALEMEEKPYERHHHDCLRCGWKWTSNDSDPAVCPKCKNARWKTKRTGNEPGPKPKRPPE